MLSDQFPVSVSWCIVGAVVCSEREADAVALLVRDGVWTDARAAARPRGQTQVAAAAIVVGAGVLDCGGREDREC